MTTFLRLELFGRRDDQPVSYVLVNVAHIVRIHPTWPSGCNIISSQVDEVSLHVTASFEQLQQRLCSTGGKTHVYVIDTPARFAEAYDAAHAEPLP